MPLACPPHACQRVLDRLATAPAQEDAILLPDADHKLVKKMFIESTGLIEDEAQPQPSSSLR